MGVFLFAGHALAQVDTGANIVGNSIALGNRDPRTMIATIINVFLGILGIVAIVIVLMGGFKWMTSDGNEEKIAEAKKILVAGLIGMAIVLAAWGIATFVMNQLLGATGGNNASSTASTNATHFGSGSGLGQNCDSNTLQPSCQPGQCDAGLTCSPSSCTCLPGPGASCGSVSNGICSANIQCIDGSKCNNSCVCEACAPGDNSCSPLITCNASNVNGQCLPDSTVCPSGQTCGTDCYCRTGQFGDACDGNSATAVCEADNSKCDKNAGLVCDPANCSCTGSPVITGISPVGGFCVNDINKACNKDADCAGSTCDMETPNGAANNFVTISGYNFGDYVTGSQVSFSDILGRSPSAVNPACGNSWTNTQIITAIPVGAKNGPIKIVNGGITAPGLPNYDLTNDTAGPTFKDFVANSIVRPGICNVNPAAGRYGNSITVNGNNLLAGSEAYFGQYSSAIKAAAAVFNGLSGTVKMPNIAAGATSLFVKNGTTTSNYAAVEKQAEAIVGPAITSFDPQTGKAGQYVTIRGTGFGGQKAGSHVYFQNLATTSEASYDFPSVCLSSLWSDNQIIVKVPQGLSDGPYAIVLKIATWSVSTTPFTFVVNSAAPLLPSLCKIEPNRGPANAAVSVWGEYFGVTPANGTFNNGIPFSGAISNDNGANKVATLVPIQAITGPVKVGSGNSLNFTVGSCTADSDCGGGTPNCCAASTAKAGQCTINKADCFSNILTSVFQWGISSGITCDGLDAAACLKTAGCTQASDGKCAPCSTISDVTSCKGAQNCCLSGTTCGGIDVAAGFSKEVSTGKCVITDCSKINDPYQCRANTQCAWDGTSCGPKDCTKITDPSLCSADIQCAWNGTSCGPKDCTKITDPSLCSANTQCTWNGTSCGPTTDCAAINNSGNKEVDCKNAGTCCLNSDGVCTSGTQLDKNTGVCGYYHTGTNDCHAKCSALSAWSATSTNSLTQAACAEICDNTGEGKACAVKDTAGNNKCDTSICGIKFNCLTATGFPAVDAADCGTCCCSPGAGDTCASINPGLSCYAGKGACSGAGRGLCCGCSNDLSCGAVGSSGCGSDTCCDARPNIESTNPKNGDTNVCRNAAIQISFDSLMDKTTLNSNNISMQLTGQSVCAPVTVALGGVHRPGLIEQIYTAVAALFSDSYHYIACALNFENAAIAGTTGGLNCPVAGTFSVDSTSGKTILTFTPIGVLQANSNYQLTVSGQFDKNDRSIGKAGVLNTKEIGMAASSTSWSFVTMDSNNPTSGLCAVDNVKITPANYLFQSNSNDLNENNIDANVASFDTVADSDKVYTFDAISKSKEILHPVVGYSWNWSKELGKPSGSNQVFTWSSFTHEIGDDYDNKWQLNVISDNIVDDGDNVTAKITFDGIPGNIYNAGAGLSTTTAARVFVCTNPWPPVVNGQWTPMKDAGNCDKLGASCPQFNYQFYYCRDAGDPNSTADDLPALGSEYNANGGKVIRGTTNVCNNNKAIICSSNNDCGGQACVSSILKESYFFYNCATKTIADYPNYNQDCRANFDNGCGGQITNPNPLNCGSGTCSQTTGACTASGLSCQNGEVIVNGSCACPNGMAYNNDLKKCTCGTGTNVCSGAQSCSTKDNNCYDKTGSMTDARDGQIYPWTRIGSQIWMAKNLNYNNGCANVAWTNYKDTGWCGCPSDNLNNCGTYGKLYQWSLTQKNICPAGWSVSTVGDFSTLTSYINSNGFNSGNNAQALKSTTGWDSGTNNFGFNVLPNDYRQDNGTYRSVFKEVVAAFWTSTLVTPTEAHGIFLNNYSNSLEDQQYTSKVTGLSVRCVYNNY